MSSISAECLKAYELSAAVFSSDHRGAISAAVQTVINSYQVSNPGLLHGAWLVSVYPMHATPTPPHRQTPTPPWHTPWHPHFADTHNLLASAQGSIHNSDIFSSWQSIGMYLLVQQCFGLVLSLNVLLRWIDRWQVEHSHPYPPPKSPQTPPPPWPICTRSRLYQCSQLSSDDGNI